MQVACRGCGVSFSADIQGPSGRLPGQPALGKCLGRGVGPGELSRSLPTPTIRDPVTPLGTMQWEEGLLEPAGQSSPCSQPCVLLSQPEPWLQPREVSSSTVSPHNRLHPRARPSEGQQISQAAVWARFPFLCPVARSLAVQGAYQVTVVHGKSCRLYIFHLGTPIGA